MSEKKIYDLNFSRFKHEILPLTSSTDSVNVESPKPLRHKNVESKLNSLSKPLLISVEVPKNIDQTTERKIIPTRRAPLPPPPAPPIKRPTVPLRPLLPPPPSPKALQQVKSAVKVPTALSRPPVDLSDKPNIKNTIEKFNKFQVLSRPPGFAHKK